MTPAEIESIYDDETPERARELLLPLAEAGDPVAQLHLGHLCDEQSPRDSESAIGWYRRAHALGYAEGTHYLASFTYFGFGTAQNVDEALRLLRISAEAGFDASQWKLGQHFLAQADHREEGLAWLQRAAAQGHPNAIELLGNERRDHRD